MKTETERMQIRCPDCGDIIATAPENDLPDGDLVCSNCGAVVSAPTQFDKVLEEVKEAVSESLASSDGSDKRDL